MQLVKALIKKTINQLEKRQRRMFPLNEKLITRDLDNLEIAAGDNVFLHTRLSTLGYLKAGPKFYIDYLLDKIGPTGNLLMPTFSSNGWSADYLSSRPKFDPVSTKSRMGIITQKFMERSDTVRSIHPTHSVTAWGALSESLTKDHHLDVNPFGEYSPFYKFLKLKSPKVLSLGLTIYPMTIFRVYESLHWKNYPVEVFEPTPFPYRALIEGEGVELQTLAHKKESSLLRANMLFENRLLKAKRLKKVKTGRGWSYLLNASDFLAFMEEEYHANNLPYIGYYASMNADAVDENRLGLTWEGR